MGKIKKQFVNFFDLSAEIVLDLPLIMQVGNEKIYLENHKGVRYFHPEEIRINIKNGLLVLEGQELEIEEINTETLCISGKIISLRYETRERGGGR